MTPPVTPALIAQSGLMQEMLDRLGRIAHSDSSVLLIGETGVGKELFAGEIHRLSPRADAPFVKVDLTALPPELPESELFGHQRGRSPAPRAKRKLSSTFLFLQNCLTIPFLVSRFRLISTLRSRLEDAASERHCFARTL